MPEDKGMAYFDNKVKQINDKYNVEDKLSDDVT